MMNFSIWQNFRNLSLLFLEDFSDFLTAGVEGGSTLQRLDGAAKISGEVNGKMPQLAGTCKMELPVMYVNDLEVIGMTGYHSAVVRSSPVQGVTHPVVNLELRHTERRGLAPHALSSTIRIPAGAQASPGLRSRWSRGDSHP